MHVEGLNLQHTADALAAVKELLEESSGTAPKDLRKTLTATVQQGVFSWQYSNHLAYVRFAAVMCYLTAYQ